MAMTAMVACVHLGMEKAGNSDIALVVEYRLPKRQAWTRRMGKLTCGLRLLCYLHAHMCKLSSLMVLLHTVQKLAWYVLHQAGRPIKGSLRFP